MKRTSARAPIKRGVRAICVLLALISAARAEGPADLLRHAPDGASVMVYIPDVELSVRAIAELGKALALPKWAELDADRLMGGFSVLSPTDKVDPAGGLLIVQHHLQGLGIICRVREPEQWVGRNDAKEVKPGLFRCQRGAEERQAMLRSGVLAIGELPQFAETALDATGEAAKKAGPAMKSCDEKTAAVAFVDIATLRPILKPAMLLARGTLLAGLNKKKQVDADTIAFWMQIFDTGFQAIDEISGISAQLRSEAEALELRASLEADELGQLRATLPKLRRSDAPLIRGVPDTRAALIFACEWGLPEGIESFGMRFVRPMFDQQTTIDAVGPEAHAEAVKRLEAMYRGVTGYCFLGDFGPKNAHLVGVGIHYSSDPAQTRDTVRALYEKSPKLLHAYLTGLVGDVEATKSDGEGGEIEVFGFPIKHPDPDAERAMRAMYGERAAFCMAVRTEGTMFAMGPADETPERMRSLIQPGKPFIENERVAAALKSLDPLPAGLVLVDPMPCVAFVTGMLSRMSLLQLDEQKSAAPAETRYLASAMYLEDERIRFQVRVPRETMEATVTAVRQLQPKNKPR